MPFVDGVFYPRRWQGHTTALFDVLPPDHPDSKATVEDRQWYDNLTEAIADLLIYIVKNVRRNYEEYRGVAWGPGVIRDKRARVRRIATLLDDDRFRSDRQVFKPVDRLAKQFGLIVYSTEPGERFNWPMPGRFVTHEEAIKIVQDAFWERWPEVDGEEIRRDP